MVNYLTGVAEIVGFLSSVLGIISFWHNNPTDFTLGMTMGLNGFEGLNSADGQAPWLESWNSINQRLSKGPTNGNQNTGSNVYFENTFTTLGGQKPASYQISAWDSAICIAYVKGKYRDGDRFAIIGDVWEQCNQSWYYSGVNFEGQYVKCGWLDRDHTNGLSAGSIRFDAAAFHNPKNINDICSTRNILFQAESRAGYKREPKDFKYYVTTSSLDTKYLCNSETSFGPNMFNNQTGTYCDMTVKKHYERCFVSPGNKKLHCVGPNGTKSQHILPQKEEFM